MPASEEHYGMGAIHEAVNSRRWLAEARSIKSHLGTTLPTLAYLLLVISGATLSSIGIGGLRADPAQPSGTMFGLARAVRSDEWLSITPSILGYMASGSEKATSSPLSEGNDLVYQLPNHGIGELLVFFDATFLRLDGVLPQPMLFAAFFWLPTLLVVLFLPRWLCRVGADTGLAWLGTALVVLAPANAWWSLMPVRTLGFAVAPCYLSIVAADRYQVGRWGQSASLATVAGLLLARTPFGYVPWEITMATPLVLATLVWLLWPNEGRMKNVRVISVVAVTSLALCLLTLTENLNSLRAEAGTVYPGQRRSGAVAQGFGTIFGAPNLGYLQTSPSLHASNYSELSTGFAVCGIWALVVWIGNRKVYRRGPDNAVLIVLALSLAFWFSWSGFSIPGSSHLPLANLVPSKRSDQTLGFLAVLLLVLVLSQAVNRARWSVAAIAAATCALVTTGAALDLRPDIPSMSVVVALVGAVGVGVVVLVITRYPQRRWPVVVASVCALAVVYSVNPVIFGFGDLRDSPTARRMSTFGRQARHDGTYWVTNFMLLDAVVIANGVPSLSGHQTSGPNEAEWHRLDPTEKYRSVWNRGASYLEFRFTQSDIPLVSLGSTQDQIVVSVNPCRLPALGFPLAGVVSTSRLPNACLHANGTVRWSGAPAYVYTLSAS